MREIIIVILIISMFIGIAFVGQYYSNKDNTDYESLMNDQTYNFDKVHPEYFNNTK